MCSIFRKGTQPKVKYIARINGGFIMFFGNSRIRFFQTSWLDCEQYGQNQYKKKEHNEHSSVFNVL